MSGLDRVTLGPLGVPCLSCDGWIEAGSTAARTAWGHIHDACARKLEDSNADRKAEIAARGLCPDCGAYLQFVERLDDGNDLFSCPRGCGEYS